MTVRQAMLLAAAAALEALAVRALAAGAGPACLALHAAASACAAAGLRGALLEARGAWSFVLPFACALFVPVLGAAGLVAVALATPPRRPAPPAKAPFMTTPLPALPAEPEAALEAVADERTPGAREDRVAALMGCRSRKEPSAIATLRRALDDPDEEVRLLAFSILEAATSGGYRRIHALEEELTRAQPAQAGRVHARLALEHWDLAWLGLVQGELLEAELARAEAHAREALERQPRSAALHFLLARIHLKQGKLTAARRAFFRAGELELPPRAWQPYVAEVAFRLRRFDLVRIHLAAAGPAVGHDAAARVQRFWA